ncbi:amino acid permease [Elusimicrobiota bacterium]
MDKSIPKKLNLLDIFCIATGAMISSGLFILPGLAHALAGPAVVFSYFLAGLLALTGMFSQAELVSAMPKTGGTYFYVTRSMGSAAGTIEGMVTWFSLSLKSAFALVGMAAFTKMLIDLNMHITAIILCLLFILINIIGIKEVGKLQNILVVGLLSILAVYIIRGFPHVDIKNFEPFAPYGIAPILTTAGFVFISFGGLLKVASVAEEVEDPEKTIPLGMIWSLAVVVVVYTIVVFITSGVLGSAELDNSLTPISDGARVFMGEKGAILMGIAAILAFISTANAGIMAASRYPVALAQDGLIPELFSKIGKRYKTPYISIIFTGLAIIIALFFNLAVLVKMASTVLISTFLFSCLSVIIMRESRLQNYEPRFKSPLYPWIQSVGIIGYGLLIYELGQESILAVLVLIILGLSFYFLYGRVRYNRESALLHLVERITARELTSRTLETELKEIIRERDNITKDRFDSIIERCVVVDIEGQITLEELFETIAEKLTGRVDVPASVISRLLSEREKETSTVIGRSAAVPHIIIEGEKKFDILLLRSKKGIVFSGNSPRVHAVFVLLGTKDERNFHLRALASIAQILQNIDFSKKWLHAKNEESLRDIVLLGKRIRQKHTPASK